MGNWANDLDLDTNSWHINCLLRVPPSPYRDSLASVGKKSCEKKEQRGFFPWAANVFFEFASLWAKGKGMYFAGQTLGSEEM